MFKVFSQCSFSIVTDGEPFKGLDLEKSVQGFVPTIVNFLMPSRGSLGKDSFEAKALGGAIDFHLANSKVVESETEYEKYLAVTGKKWWFPFFNKNKKLKRRIAMHREVFEVARARAEDAFVALPA